MATLSHCHTRKEATINYLLNTKYEYLCQNIKPRLVCNLLTCEVFCCSFLRSFFVGCNWLGCERTTSADVGQVTRYWNQGGDRIVIVNLTHWRKGWSRTTSFVAVADNIATPTRIPCFAAIKAFSLWTKIDDDIFWRAVMIHAVLYRKNERGDWQN